MPDWLAHTYMHQTLWQWIALSFSMLTVFLVPYLLHLWQRKRSGPQSRLLRAWLRIILPVSAAVIALGVGHFVNEQINITGDVLIVTLTILEVLVWLMISWTVILLGSSIAESIIASPRVDPRGIDASLVRTVSRLVCLTLALLVLMEGISGLGISLIPVLTGLGVAGLALSLAARPTIENVIGGIMLYADRPVRVGDVCQFGKTIGEVVHIGLRSTRIRGLDRTLISVPNSDFSQLELVNLTRRDRIRLKTLVGLRYETSPEQLRFVLAKLREMLLAHPKIYEDPARVRFVGFGAYSLDIEVYAFAKTRDWYEFLGIQEDVLLRIMQIVESSGTGFAFPSQTAYLSRDAGLDKERSLAAEKEVQTWREKDELPFPEFQEEFRLKIQDTLDFPPNGSPGEMVHAKSESLCKGRRGRQANQ